MGGQDQSDRDDDYLVLGGGLKIPENIPTLKKAVGDYIGGKLDQAVQTVEQKVETGVENVEHFFQQEYHDLTGSPTATVAPPPDPSQAPTPYVPPPPDPDSEKHMLDEALKHAYNPPAFPSPQPGAGTPLGSTQAPGPSTTSPSPDDPTIPHAHKSDLQEFIDSTEQAPPTPQRRHPRQLPTRATPPPQARPIGSTTT